MLFATVAALGFELAIPICLDDRDCANLLALCGFRWRQPPAWWGLSAGSTYALDLLSVGALAPYHYLLPIGLVCLGGYYIMAAVATRAGAFGMIARTRISQGLSGPLLNTAGGAGRRNARPGHRLRDRPIQRNASTVHALFWANAHGCARSPGEGSPGRPALYRISAICQLGPLLDEAGGGLVLFMLFAACYSPSIAGFMFLSERVIMRPLLMISTSLLQVFTGEAGRSVSQVPLQLRRRFARYSPPIRYRCSMDPGGEPSR